MLVPRDILFIMVATAILTLGLASLVAAAFVDRCGKRGFLWFGLFAAPYGAALLCRTFLPPGSGNRMDAFVVLFGKLSGLVSAIPAMLLFREWYGDGWHAVMKAVMLLYGVAVVIVLGLMAMHDRPRAIPSPGILLIILFPIVLILDRAAGYRVPPLRYRRLVFAGLCAFFVAFSYDHIAHWRDGNEQAMTEPIGFTVLLICFGIAVSRQVAAEQAEWISMRTEMEAARKIQAAILPATTPAVSGVSIAARYSPMTSVAGDFYCFLPQGAAQLSVVLADVMGHGVPAALVASMVKVSVLASEDRKRRPGEILEDVNTMLYREAPGQYSTAVYLSIDGTSGSGSYSAAAHPPPLLWRRAMKSIEQLDGGGLLLGFRPTEGYGEERFSLGARDRLLIYSDGLTEAENERGATYGDTRLRSFIQTEETLATEAFASALLADVRTWSSRDGAPAQQDDITFVVMDFH